jgi:energy-converting hydrogenase Eha subunit F
MKKGSKQKKPAHKRIEKVFSAMLCILSALGLAKDIALNQNEHFLFPPAADQSPKEYAQAMRRL